MSQKEIPTTKNNMFERLKTWDKKWDKKHPKALNAITWIAITALSLTLSGTIFLLSIPFGLFMALSIDAVKALIEANATILGFFGLIAVYLLTSYDNRIDKLEEKLLDRQIDVNRENLLSLQKKMKNRKTRATVAIMAAFISLVVSFFLSMSALGILGINPTTPTTTALQYSLISVIVSSTLLFVGVFSIFILLYRIGKEPD